MSKILIADDDPNIRRVLSEFLELEDFTVHAVEDGQQVLDEVSDFNPDIILLDVMMPNMNGYQCLENLRSQEKFKDTPILLLTARSDHEDLLLGDELGADSYLVKPFNFEELLEVLQENLSYKR